jgi:carboxylesterase
MTATAIGTLLVAGTITAAWLSRRRNRSRYETGSHPTAPPAVLPGAEPIFFDGEGRGVLILHGFGDTPQSVRTLARYLHQRGWSVRAPLLSGHGSSMRAFTSATAGAWISDAHQELAGMQKRCAKVAVIGQSMGGALATILAAESRIDALVLLAPYMRLSRRAKWIGRFHYAVSIFLPYLTSRSESSILDPEARGRALGRGLMTPRLVHELSRVVGRARAAAKKVRVPTLVIHSPQDPRVSVAHAEAAFADLGCEKKTLRWAQRSGHVLTVDYDREWVAGEVAEWLDRHCQVPDADSWRASAEPA